MKPQIITGYYIIRCFLNNPSTLDKNLMLQIYNISKKLNDYTLYLYFIIIFCSYITLCYVDLFSNNVVWSQTSFSTKNSSALPYNFGQYPSGLKLNSSFAL